MMTLKVKSWIFQRRRKRAKSIIENFLKFILLRLSTFVINQFVFVNKKLEKRLLRNFLKVLGILREMNMWEEEESPFQKISQEGEIQKWQDIIQLIEWWQYRRTDRFIDCLNNKALDEAFRFKREYMEGREYWIDTDNGEVVAEHIEYLSESFWILFVENMIFLIEKKILEKFEEIVEKTIRDKQKPKFFTSFDFNFLGGVILKLRDFGLINTETLKDIVSIFDEPSLKKRYISKKSLRYILKKPLKNGKKLCFIPIMDLRSMPITPEEREKLKGFWNAGLETLDFEGLLKQYKES